MDLKRAEPDRCPATALLHGKVKQCVKKSLHEGVHSVWIKGRQHFEWEPSVTSAGGNEG